MTTLITAAKETIQTLTITNSLQPRILSKQDSLILSARVANHGVGYVSRCLACIVTPPNSNTFPSAGERVRCRWSILTNSLERTKLTNSLGKNKLNSRLIRHQFVFLETKAKFLADRRPANDFFAACVSSFELRGVTKHLMAGSTETVSFVSLGASH